MKNIDLTLIEALRSRHKIFVNLKASNEQLVADLDGIISRRQRRLLKLVLQHIRELKEHIHDVDTLIDQI